jgi:hypothetical protein
MYDNLVITLRNNADHYMTVEGEAGLVHLLTDAADAIEELSTFESAFRSMVEIGGWWLVGNDGNIHSMNVPMNWPPKGTKTVQIFPIPPREETE